MQREQLNRIFVALLLVSDAGVICASFFFAWWARFDSGLIAFSHYPPMAEYLRALPLAAALYLIIFNYAGLYRARADGIGSAELKLIVPAVLIGALGVFALGFLYRGFSYSRLVVAIMAVSSIVLLRITRGLLLLAQDRLRARGVGVLRVAILGDQADAKALAATLERRPGHGISLAGFIGPETSELTPHLGGRPELGAVLSRGDLDEVWVVDTTDRELLAEVVSTCQRAEVDCRILANLLGFPTYRLQLEDRFGLPLLSLRGWPLDRQPNRLLKRTVDIVASALGLVVLAPLFITLALSIKLSSPGPVLYRQVRVGRHGRRFNMLKFRSMRHDAEEETGPVRAVEADPRRTGLGALMRRWSIDELPQLVNVLKGEMSLVGPRPERPAFVAKFREEFQRYDDRHRVAPGMTGWSQVHGLRGNTCIGERTRYDLYYLENWTFWLDIKIVVRTVLGIFHHRHAY